MSSFEGKVVIVTGAAQGIGRAIADAFAEAGAAVGLIDRDTEQGHAAAEQVSAATGGLTHYADADVSDPEQVAGAVESIAVALGPPTVLVNNAAVFVLKGLEASVEEWRASFDVNVMGAALVTRCVVPHMRAEGGGAIVNIGSVSSFVAQRGTLVYNASKGAIVEMTRCLALDLADDNIRVNSACPATVWTPAVAQMVAGLGLTRETVGDQPNFGREQILKRIPDPPEIARAVLFLASDDASFITGENLMVDGGWTAR
jgi:NAD(P)-dependent dehydrogenase (short-subunit alcohol dehydrogenase family)